MNETIIMINAFISTDSSCDTNNNTNMYIIYSSKYEINIFGIKKCKLQ